MKKLIKATAILLAVSVLLTGCNKGTETANKSPKTLEKEFDVYNNSSITEVEDQTYTVNNMTGKYSGDWKGNRPEGEGTLWLNDDEYFYSKNWSNGEINGQGEIKTVGDDGAATLYVGECAYNSPYGMGQMTIDRGDGSYQIIAEGDFSDFNTLLLYTIDDKGKLLDVGGYDNDSHYVSYVENPTFTVIDNFFCDRGSAGQANYYNSRQSVYIGQVNEKGLPNGYGYYEEAYDYTYSHTYKAIGSWKNGNLQGYFTEESVDWGSTVTSKTDFWGAKQQYTETFCNTVKQEGYLKGSIVSGSYSKYEKYETSPSKATDGVFVTKFDESTSIETTGKHTPDGAHHYETLHKTGVTTYDAGTYYKYDKNDELVIHREYQNGDWVTLTDLEKEREEARQRFWEIGGPVLAVGLMVGMFALVSPSAEEQKELESWKDALVARTDANVADYFTETKKRTELLDEKRRVEEEARRDLNNRSELLKKADDLQREADSHYRSAFSF